MDLVRAALAFPRRRSRAVSTAAFVPGVRPMPTAPRPAAVVAELCTRTDGALVLVVPRQHAPDARLLPLGRACIEPHHLSPVSRARLLEDGCIELHGLDAENVLLAFGSAWTVELPA
jgi:hypothetical protein